MTKHLGGCHCGLVRYEVETDLQNIIACNCSHCSAKGLVLTFVPEQAFKLLTGEGELAEYQFNKRVIEHLFCRTCGVQSFSRGKGKDGETMVAINVRCLDGVALEQLSITPFDGKAY